MKKGIVKKSWNTKNTFHCGALLSTAVNSGLTAVYNCLPLFTAGNAMCLLILLRFTVLGGIIFKNKIDVFCNISLRKNKTNSGDSIEGKLNSNCIHLMNSGSFFLEFMRTYFEWISFLAFRFYVPGNCFQSLLNHFQCFQNGFFLRQFSVNQILKVTVVNRFQLIPYLLQIVEN